MEWKLCRKKEYEVALCKASADRVYNMPEAGKVYNYLEDVVEEIEGECYVCRGTMDELYLIPPAKLDAYDVDPADVGEEWVTAKTRPNARVYACRRAEGDLYLVTPAGVMHANRRGVPHGEGDMILCAVAADGAPIEGDCWIVNGVVFDRTYEILR